MAEIKKAEVINGFCFFFQGLRSSLTLLISALKISFSCFQGDALAS